MLIDFNDVEVYYWPVTNLVEGNVSETIIIKTPTPSDGYLRATADARLAVWAKWTAFPGNPFTRINQGVGIHLTGIPAPYGEFQIYVQAIAPIGAALVRVPISVIASDSTAAGWKV